MDVHIGITTSFEEGEQRLHHAYVRAIEQAGGIPIVVPMLETSLATAKIAQLLDCKILNI